MLKTEGIPSFTTFGFVFFQIKHQRLQIVLEAVSEFGGRTGRLIRSFLPENAPSYYNGKVFSSDDNLTLNSVMAQDAISEFWRYIRNKFKRLKKFVLYSTFCSRPTNQTHLLKHFCKVIYYH